MSSIPETSKMAIKAEISPILDACCQACLQSNDNTSKRYIIVLPINGKTKSKNKMTAIQTPFARSEP